MKNLCKALWAVLAPLLFVAAPGFADGRCSLASDGSQFTKADGGHIYLLFGKHQDPQDGIGPDFIDRELKADSSSAEKIKAFVDHVLAARLENRQSLDHQREMIFQLSEQGKIDWVAWEGLPANHSDSLQEQLRAWTEDLRSQVLAAGVSPDKTKALFSYAWGPFMDRVFAGDPLAARFLFVGFDSDQLKKRELSLSREANKISFEGLNHEDLQKMLDLVAQKVDGPGVISRAERDHFADSFDPQFQSRVRDYVALSYEEDQIRETRSARAAKATLLMPGDGVLVMGTNHGPSVIRHLKRVCERPNLGL